MQAYIKIGLHRPNIEARGDGDWSHWRLTAAVKMSVPWRDGHCGDHDGQYDRPLSSGHDIWNVSFRQHRIKQEHNPLALSTFSEHAEYRWYDPFRERTSILKAYTSSMIQQRNGPVIYGGTQVYTVFLF